MGQQNTMRLVQPLSFHSAGLQHALACLDMIYHHYTQAILVFIIRCNSSLKNDSPSGVFCFELCVSLIPDWMCWVCGEKKGQSFCCKLLGAQRLSLTISLDRAFQDGTPDQLVPRHCCNINVTFSAPLASVELRPFMLAKNLTQNGSFFKLSALQTQSKL